MFRTAVVLSFLCIGSPSALAQSAQETPKAFEPAPSMMLPRASAAVVVDEGTVLAIGGENIEGPLRSVESWSPGDEYWKSQGRMKVPRVRHTATLLAEGGVLVAGGGGRHPMARLAEVWGIGDNAGFADAGRMLANRSRHTATLLKDGRVLVVGGRDAGERPLASAEIWDPRDLQWRATGSMKEARCCHTATLLQDGRVLIVGGLRQASCARSLGEDTRVRKVCFVSLASAELWDPRTGRFIVAESLPEDENRAAHTATLLHDGRVLIAGGAPDEDQTDYAHSDFLWNSSTGKWKRIEDGADRIYHTATLLKDGRVLAVGGVHNTCGCCAILPGAQPFWESASIFDPASEKWLRAGRPGALRARHGAALLPSGQVLLIGGQSEEWGKFDIFANAELWTPAPKLLENDTSPAKPPPAKSLPNAARNTAHR